MTVCAERSLVDGFQSAAITATLKRGVGPLYRRRPGSVGAWAFFLLGGSGKCPLGDSSGFLSDLTLSTTLFAA